MKSVIIYLIAAATLSLANPFQKSQEAAATAQSIPPACAICDGLGAACIAACIAGGPLDPLCDICAGPSIGECLAVSEVFHVSKDAISIDTTSIVSQCPINYKLSGQKLADGDDNSGIGLM
jgi:hypothetical protein